MHPAAPIPQFLEPLKARAAAWLGVDAARIRHALVLRDDARWRWQHSIPPTKALRYSITFRTLA